MFLGKKKKGDKGSKVPPAATLPPVPPPASLEASPVEPASIKIPVKESPKILISTSLTPNASSTSSSSTSTASTSTSTPTKKSSVSKPNSSTNGGMQNSSSSSAINNSTTPVTTSIKPNDETPAASFQVYLNSSEIKASRASMWPSTYDIRTLNIFEIEKKVYLEFLSEDASAVIVRAEASQMIAVEDSTRYFIIMQAHHEVSPKIIRNTGFAFYTRDEAQSFLQFAKSHADIDIPVVTASEFASVDVKHREMKIVPLLQVEPEGYIEEEEMLQIDAFAKQMLSQLDDSNVTAETKPERLNAIRDSITQRLSRQGLGVIVTKEERRLSSLLPKGIQASKNLPIYVAIRRVVNAIASELETPSDAKKIADFLNLPENENYEGDLEMLVEQLFGVIGHETVTTKVFKALTQAIIHTATYQIKTKIQTDIMTGDVRGPEGWQIVVLFAHDVINITHRRREKSLDSLGPKHQFWYEWVLHMVFDKKMGDMASATLRICDIGYGANIDPAAKDHIANTFCNGNLLIA